MVLGSFCSPFVRSGWGRGGSGGGGAVGTPTPKLNGCGSCAHSGTIVCGSRQLATLKASLPARLTDSA